MSGFLFDTNVLSETRKASPDQGVVRFISGVAREDFYTSAIVIAELRIGAERRTLTHPDEGESISQWIDGLERRFLHGRILVVDAKVASIYAKMQMQRDRPIMDTLIAATAIANGMVVVTRNVRDFVDLDVEVQNPWS